MRFGGYIFLTAHTYAQRERERKRKKKGDEEGGDMPILKTTFHMEKLKTLDFSTDVPAKSLAS